MKFMRLVPAVSFLFCIGLVFSGCAHPIRDEKLENSFRQNRKKKMDDSAFAAALEQGVDPNQIFKNGATPLIMSVRCDRPDRIEMLLKHGADINKPGKRGGTPLHIAAGLGRNKCLAMLLKHGAKVNTIGAFGRSPLMDAARMGHLKIMEDLIDAGAHVNARDKMDRTPLMHAAEAPRNSLEAVRMLVSNGADSNLYDKDLKTAAMHAAELKHTDAALYLIDLIPDLAEKPALNLMIMHSAIKGGDMKVLERLVDRRPPLNRSLSLVLKGTKILQVHGFYRILIRNGLLGKGRVPLHWAAIENNLDAVKLLIARGADPFLPDELGHTPDDLATSREVIGYIRKQQKTIRDLSRDQNEGTRK